jgi:D-alanyl-D-alanine dipeptidase
MKNQAWEEKTSRTAFNEWFSIPIPTIPDVEISKNVRILECGEPLVSLSRISSGQFFIRPQYYLCGYKNALEEVLLRERMAHLLLRVAESLIPEFRLLIFDGWRPIELQRDLFERQKETVKRENPFYNKEQIIEKVETYVSFPSGDPLAPAPHYTGGAVDLSVCDKAGQPLRMGTEFDYFGPEAKTRYYEDRLASGDKLTNSEYVFLKNRRLLYHAMTSVGFTSYREEWWHFDYGNQFWAKIEGKTAIYGPMNYGTNASRNK